MLAYIVRRFLYMILLLWLVSIAAFVVIELPPGDYLTYVMSSPVGFHGGMAMNEEDIANLRSHYGLDRPAWQRYFKWVGNILRGDFGRSFTSDRPVIELIADRLPLTIFISLLTLLFTFVVGIPIGIYSAIKQYSVGDYIATVFGLVGLAIPNFLIALVLLFLAYKYFGVSLTGLFSGEYLTAPWSFAKIVDLLKHLPVPVIVVGTAGTAGIIRVMRATLLDELQKQYVVTARAKGTKEGTLIFKYPVRVALNPIISTIGWLLPAIVSGTTITAIVLDLPTTGSMLYNALMMQDTYLAGSTVMFLSFLTVIGTFVSDIILSWIDPRIRYERSR